MASTLAQIENNCFGCGPANPVGLRLEFAIESGPEGPMTASAAVRLTRDYQGGHSNLHGGIIATLMDEIMSKLNKALGVAAVTRHLAVDYLRPSPVEVELRLVGRHIRREGRKLFHEAELRNADGDILARATGLFIVVEQSA